MQSDKRRERRLYTNNPEDAICAYVILLQQRKREKRNRNIFQYIRDCIIKHKTEKLIEQCEKKLIELEILTKDEIRRKRILYLDL